jgi:transposase
MRAPKKNSDELRERATRLAIVSGRPVAHVARDLGIDKEALRTWVRQAKADAAGGIPTVLSSAEREKLTRLRGEVRELRQANEILKAALVLFAKELGVERRRRFLSITGARLIGEGFVAPSAAARRIWLLSEERRGTSAWDRLAIRGARERIGRRSYARRAVRGRHR